MRGMPNALMEAMAIGVPSISTDCPCGGPRELLGEELSDMLTPVGDVEALADKMLDLLSDEKNGSWKKNEKEGRDVSGRESWSRIGGVCKLNMWRVIVCAEFAGIFLKNI